ncbi:AraC family transcriptional regulator [Pedobacter nyackensis]|nr:AraC family transcriptional regulator [Pedobacter nyackensis]
MPQNVPIRHITRTSKASAFPQSFSIRKIEVLLHGQNMVQELHRHDFFYLLALKKGSGHHDIDFVPYAIADYSVFFIRPGQVHALVLKSDSMGYLINFSSDFYNLQDKVAKQLLGKASSTNHYQLDAEENLKFTSLLDYIYREHATKKPNYETVILANMSILFVELIRQNTSDASGNNNLYAQERLEKFLELLETHIFTHKQVSQYAKLLNISTYQLNAITKTMLGKTSSALINEQIVLEAKRCLLATTNQVNQTAYLLGYEDVSYFIRFFKKHTGFTPEAFRHNFS